MARTQIQLNLDGDGRLYQAHHFLSDEPTIEPHANAHGVDTPEPWIDVRIGTATLYLSPAQAEALLNELGNALAKIPVDVEVVKVSA